MIQDIFPHKYDNTYRNDPPEDGDTLIVIRNLGSGKNTPDNNQSVCCRFFEEDGAGRIGLPTVAEAEDLWNVRRDSLWYLFRIDGESFYLCTEEAEEKEGFVWKQIMQIRGAEPAHLSFAVPVAAHLAHWYASSRFCGRCGTALIHSSSQRSLRCPACGQTIFPRINPIVIAAVVDGDRILVARYNQKHFKQASRHYVLLAGYVEIGESYEDTVRREIREETGLEIRNIRYIGSQPWPFSQTSIAGFYVEADSRRPLRRQADELAELLWVRREDLPPRKNLTSVTDNLMEWFRRGLTVEEILRERR